MKIIRQKIRPRRGYFIMSVDLAYVKIAGHYPKTIKALVRVHISAK